MNQKISGFFCCLIAAFFWGTTFVAQDVAAATIPSFTFLSLRSVVGVAALLLLILIRRAMQKRRGTYTPMPPAARKRLLLGGTVCGCFLFAASALQQFGIAGNPGSPGKDAFITALYIVFLPVMGLFFKKRAEPHVYACVLVALAGLWLLCMRDATLTTGDIQLIACSLLYACQMLAVELLGPEVDGFSLSATQFGVVAILSTLFALFFETPTAAGILAGWWTVLYAGILSTGVAYTLQIIGQQKIPGAVSCLVLSLESVFGVLSGLVALHLMPSTAEWIGMALIFVAIVAAQLPFPYQYKKTPRNAKEKRM